MARSEQTVERNAAAFRVAYGGAGGVILHDWGITRYGFLPPRDMAVRLDGESRPVNIGKRAYDCGNSNSAYSLSAREAAVLQGQGIPLTADGKKIAPNTPFEQAGGWRPPVPVAPVAGSGLGSSAAGPSGPAAGLSGAAGGGVPVRDEAGRMRAAASVWAAERRGLGSALGVSAEQRAQEWAAFNRLPPEEREFYSRLVDQRMAEQSTAAAAGQEVSSVYGRSVGGGTGPSNAGIYASSLPVVMPGPSHAGAPVAGVSGPAGGGVSVRDEAWRMRAAASVRAARNRGLEGALGVSEEQRAQEWADFQRLSPREREFYGRLVDQRMAEQSTAAAAGQEVSSVYGRSVGGGTGPSNAGAYASSLPAVMPGPSHAGASRSR
ncbi:osmotically-inducible protein OsmY [Streptomyces sp. B3I7]|nr:osmotically-inducible protein OsmY [Streptomyces sp. B3I7]